VIVPGLTAAGLEIATFADVREDLNTRWREEFGASADVSDRSPDGQQIGIVAEPIAKLWELLEAINSSQDPNKATDALLDALCALTGTTRRPASFSTVSQTLTGIPTSPVISGSLVSTVSTGQQFITTEDVTIAAATAWVALTTYTAGDRRTNNGNIYLCITGGTSAASGGPVGVDPDPDVLELDGDVEWRSLGEGTGFVDVVARATETGPIVAAAGDLTGIDSPTGGWSSTVNVLDATPGRVRMTNAELRVLRVLELQRPGTSPKDAIRVALLDVGKNTSNPVTSATVFQNVTDFTDADGVPPHSVEALVLGGEDQEIWDALLANVAAGIRTHGTEVGTAIDRSGVAQPEAFSRTEEIQIYESITLVKDPNVYPDDGDDQVKLAVATRGNAKPDGTDVVSGAQLAAVFDVAGVISVDLPLISAAPTIVPVATTTIAISLRQRAVYDTSRITVTSTNGTP
jgi:uncharacterized phage protein gp47/JayE